MATQFSIDYGLDRIRLKVSLFLAREQPRFGFVLAFWLVVGGCVLIKASL